MLHMVLLGGNHPNAKIEVHDVVFIHTDDIHQSYDKLRELWFGDKKRVHIDSWMAVHGVDGFCIELRDTPQSTELRLFFINLGGYIPDQFGEEHRYLLVAADNELDAKTSAKQRILSLWDKPHKDNLYDVDHCLQLDKVDGLFIHLVKGAYPETKVKNEYTIICTSSDLI
jgi:hypothetical protein